MKERVKLNSKPPDLLQKVRRMQRKENFAEKGLIDDTPGPGWLKFNYISPFGCYHVYPEHDLRPGYNSCNISMISDSQGFCNVGTELFLLNLVNNSKQKLDIGALISNVSLRPYASQLLVCTLGSMVFVSVENCKFSQISLINHQESVYEAKFLKSQTEKAILVNSYMCSEVFDMEKKAVCYKLDVHPRYIGTDRNSSNLIAMLHEEIGIVLYDTRTRRFSAKLGNIGLRVNSLTFHGDGHIAASSNSRKIYLWDIRKENQLTEFQVPESITGLAYCASNGLLLASCSYSRSLSVYKVWDKSWQTLWLGGERKSSCFSESGKKLYIQHIWKSIELMEIDVKSLENLLFI